MSQVHIHFEYSHKKSQKYFSSLFFLLLTNLWPQSSHPSFEHLENYSNILLPSHLTFHNMTIANHTLNKGNIVLVYT